MRFSLDSNILVYAVKPDEGEKYRRAKWIVDNSFAGDCFLTLQSLGEFAHVVMRKRIVEPPEILAQVHDWQNIFPTMTADITNLHGALELCAIGRLSYWDALLVSTAASAGCTVLLSEDMQDGAEYGGVTIRNPFRGSELPGDIAALLD